MAGASRDQALALLAAANNHGDLAVKLSSLRQAKDILLAVHPSFAAELFPYLVELQSSPETLVRKSLIEAIEEIGLKAMEHSSILVSVLLVFLRDGDSIIAKQSIVSGTNFFCSVLEELALQFHRHGKVERWLEELWVWMVKFKDAVLAIALGPGPFGVKILAMKFLETYVLHFTSDANDFEKSSIEARKRPHHYNMVLSALLDFDSSIEMVKGHSASVQYSLRTAFLGFLRCTCPTIIESRDRLLRALRSMNAGDAADQVIRQVDKMMKNNERASRDARLGRDDPPSSQLSVPGDLFRKRSMHQDNEEPTNGHGMTSKRIRYGHNMHSASHVQMSDSGQDCASANGVSLKVPLLDNDLTPVEQMIAMICALVAEGERGAESLEILISQIHPDLLADIIVTNMKQFSKVLSSPIGFGNLPVSGQTGSSSSPAPAAPTITMQSSVLPAQVPFSTAAATSMAHSDMSTVINLPADSKRDPRRDPRRLDPRRVGVPVGLQSVHMVEDTGAIQAEFDGSISLSKPPSLPVVTSVENTSTSLVSKTEGDDKILKNALISETDQPISREELLDGAKEVDHIPEIGATSDAALSPACTIDEDLAAPESLDIAVADGADTSPLIETDEHSPARSNTYVSEETSIELPLPPPYVELTEDQKIRLKKLALERIIDSYVYSQETDCSHTRMALLARLVAQIDGDEDVVVMLQKHVLLDYQGQKGHELVLHILYHLHSLMISDSVEHSSFAAVVYEKFLLAVVNSLLEKLPASDKSFSKLLGEVPLLPDSALKLLDDLCSSDVTDQHGKVIRDRERVTQGLGAVWSLILGRPLNRQACLNIALKCAVHSQDDIRTKAIRLVANKLYLLSYISENIQQYATDMLLSAVNQHISDPELSQSGSSDQRLEGETGSLETSVSGSQISEPGTSENDPMKGSQSVQNISTVEFHQAQRLISLFFALCTKKPNLLQLVFNIYGRAPKAVKQAIHRHIPIIIGALGPLYPELLSIISDPPEGSENLLTQVLKILTEEKTPTPHLIAIVKHLYETKLKDATILIPMLSLLSRNEVLPIFPRLIDLPLDKFQDALANILQGSAHTGPALTPAEVLVAIHDISPEKDGIALKKITEACSACFEQRTVFTPQVLAKALNQMVDHTPLPLLFMRTVIQAIDAYPTLVDFVMEILSKLVSKQVWRMPKLWVGFLKCVSQTQPHSFRVLLQLPAPQLESALNKHANLRGPLSAYASQPSIKSSLPRSILIVLGLVNEPHMQQSHPPSSLHSSDTSSSVHGATLT
ncbi:hypothetical protein PVL29_023574 [Vitis rotundifolia]|uniref:Symplekin n=1 Tax=Vitis rotundifolia TaxID=103349 RepID=A0AA38YPA4_VITRO|nr:hypothetical protein PVL29_023574 [Vitis rotundifolia]